MEDSTTKHTFPFQSRLNLRLLLEFWEEKLRQGEGSLIPGEILTRIEQATELRQSIEDLSILDKHRDLIRFLLSAAIPFANNDTELSAAIIPFQNKSIFSTRAFDRAIPLEKLDEMVSTNIPDNHLITAKTVHACLLILNKFYGVPLDFSMPVLLTVRDQNGLDKVYKAEINKQFCEVISKREPEPIDPHVVKFLTEKIYDLDLLLQYIRPENFEFHGFIILKLTDVTEGEMLSSIKYDLIRKDAVSNPEMFRVIQQKLRSIFSMPDLMLGLAYFDPNNNLILNNGYEDCWKSLANTAPGDCSYAGSIYERSWMEKRPMVIEDLASFPYKTKIEEALLANGIRSLLLAPLVYENETIGLLELACLSPGKLTPTRAAKVDNVLPMFTVAVNRVRSDMETEVRALIQEECTAIHPTVQWRFFEAGFRLLNKRSQGEDAQLEEITFSHVFPFYGLIDVRNSSLKRNEAIQADLHENLRIIQQLVDRLREMTGLPLLDELMFKTQHQKETLQHRLAAGDEVNILSFIRNEINPVLDYFSGREDTHVLVEDYKSKLDPDLHIIYKKRKAFEESLNRVNATVASIIDEAEEEAQHVFPHYFEKYKTDGVEFTLYVGDSLVKQGTFDSFHLKNFRLWQLLLMCTIYDRMLQLKPTLSEPLDVTQLILVHDQPVTIRFRQDEKQFDIDGAYDIRYEIVKKRIDKAYIRNTNERLTQPGKVAVVYSHEKVAEEYRQYFRYMMERGMIERNIEELELEELPGANGLRALRFTISTAQPAIPSVLQANLLQTEGA